MSLHDLKSDDFRLTSNKVMTLNRGGSALVFFKMNSCNGCEAFDAIFKELAQRSNRIDSYCIANISHHREIVSMSRTSSTPINTVPLIILYSNGIPFAKYTGSRTLQNLLSFIEKSLEKLPQSTAHNFVTPQQGQRAPQNGQQGMYGAGAYQHPPLNPQDGYNRQQQRQPPYAQLSSDVEEEDDTTLEVPKQVIPHNMPWEGGYRKMGTGLD